MVLNRPTDGLVWFLNVIWFQFIGSFLMRDLHLFSDRKVGSTPVLKLERGIHSCSQTGKRGPRPKGLRTTALHFSFLYTFQCYRKLLTFVYRHMQSGIFFLQTSAALPGQLPQTFFFINESWYPFHNKDWQSTASHDPTFPCSVCTPPPLQHADKTGVNIIPSHSGKKPDSLCFIIHWHKK